MRVAAGPWGMTARALAAAGVCLGLAAFPGVRAQSTLSNDEGIEAGPWTLAPYLRIGYSRDDNVFRRADEQSVETDDITNLSLGAVARLPFRMSELELGYDGSTSDYSETGAVDNEITHELSARLDLLFSRGDKLVLAERYTQGATDVTRVDEGGELVFDGEPFSINDWDVELSRMLSGRRGYSLRLGGSEVSYDSPESSSFFDYDRTEVELQYREPISPHSWLEFSYRRLDEDQFRDAFREQDAERLLVGLRGQLGKGNNALVRVGVEGVDLDSDSASSSFEGIVGSGDWNRSLGSGGSLTLGVNRQVLPSFFDTHYVATGLQARFEHRWPSRLRAGASIRAWKNRYGDPLDWNGACGSSTPAEECPASFIRTDDQTLVESFLAWVPHSRVEVLVSINRQRRRSNFERADYESTVFAMALAFGWNR